MTDGLPKLARHIQPTQLTGCAMYSTKSNCLCACAQEDVLKALRGMSSFIRKSVRAEGLLSPGATLGGLRPGMAPLVRALGVGGGGQGVASGCGVGEWC